MRPVVRQVVLLGRLCEVPPHGGQTGPVRRARTVVEHHLDGEGVFLEHAPAQDGVEAMRDHDLPRLGEPLQDEGAVVGHQRHKVRVGAVPVPVAGQGEVDHARARRADDADRFAAAVFGDLAGFENAAAGAAFEQAARETHRGTVLFQDFATALETREDHGFRAVKVEDGRPGAQGVLEAECLDHVFGDGTGAVVELRRGVEDGQVAYHVAYERVALEDVLAVQGAQGVDEGCDVRERVHFDFDGHVGLRPRLEPEAHLGHDAEVALQEQSFDRGAETVLAEVCGRCVRGGPLPRTDDVAVGEDHFEAADVVPVVAEGVVAYTSIESLGVSTSPTSLEAGVRGGM